MLARLGWMSLSRKSSHRHRSPRCSRNSLTPETPPATPRSWSHREEATLQRSSG
ncbi:MAG: hypothetical protein Q8P67_14400 [archaeon]|nr:hypothetical protein [archaeon]